MRGSSSNPVCPEHQADATLSQAAPVQNTWYTILDTAYNVRIYYMNISVATANEDLEIKLTIDGQALVGSQAAVAGTNYTFYKAAVAGTLSGVSGATDTVLAAYRCFIEARSVKIEVRKTSATGAGILSGRVVYAKF